MGSEPGAYTITYGSCRDIGLVRQENQDQLVSFDSSVFGLVFLLADGMGGHAGGAIAANMAITGFKRHFLAVSARLPLWESLTEAARLTNLDIYEKGNEPDGAQHGLHMGSTLVLCVVSGGGYTVAHVGDSRCYAFRNGVLTRMTRDHTAVQKMVDAGIILPEEAKNHPDASVLTKAFGQRAGVELEISEPQPLAVDEVLLLCSDGLYGYVEEADIVDRLSRHPDPQAAADALLQLALDAGGHDNISIFVIRAEPSSTKGITVPDPPEEEAASGADVLPGPAAVAGTAVIPPAAAAAAEAAKVLSVKAAPLAPKPQAAGVAGDRSGSRMRLAWWLIGVAVLLAVVPLAAFLRPEAIPAGVREKLLAWGIALPVRADAQAVASIAPIPDNNRVPPPATTPTPPVADSGGGSGEQTLQEPTAGKTAAEPVAPPASAATPATGDRPPVLVTYPPDGDAVFMNEVSHYVKEIRAAGFQVKEMVKRLDDPSGVWHSFGPHPASAVHLAVVFLSGFTQDADRICRLVPCSQPVRAAQTGEFHAIQDDLGTGGVVVFVQPLASKPGPATAVAPLAPHAGSSGATGASGKLSPDKPPAEKNRE